ncbi:MAG TPA: ABC transporter substrate-binding protein, partial [Pilimelia sp.]|nr:ABC transporter substrate-binding protein [Pilimelia sp.]
ISPARAGGGPLRIGGLLPRTGAADLLFPRVRAGAMLAIKELNAEGGVLDDPVEWLDRDDGTDPVVARRGLAQLVKAKTHVVIGPGTSGVAREIMPDVVRAGVVLFSPSNTAADLSQARDDGLYFRTAPSDVLQGRALADIVMRDGAQRVAIVARDDAYGTGLQANVRDALINAGRAEKDLKLITYRPADPVDFAGGAQEVRSFGAEAVLVLGLAESAAVIKALAAAGLPVGR